MILVTGASGFIGRHVLDSLLRDYSSVYVLLHKNNSQLSEDNRIKIIRGDITEKIDLPSDVKTIYHCAGELYQKDQMVRVNIYGTENVSQVALKQGCSLMYLSSAGVVGKHKSKLIDENSECKPRTHYEKTKYVAEKIVLKYVDLGLNAKIVRPTIVIGEKRDIHKDSFLQLLSAMVSKKYKNICDGKGIYNVVHVNEVVRAMRMLDNDAISGGQIFIINSPITFKALSRIVTEEVFGARYNFLNIPLPAALFMAIVFSFISLLIGGRVGLTIPRLRTFTNQYVFSQRLLEETIHYQPLKSVEEYIREVCRQHFQVIPHFHTIAL
jgi:nucleoside-diphosphate-sugar epimerase